MIITCKTTRLQLFYSIYYLSSCSWSFIFWSCLVLIDTISWYMSWSSSHRASILISRGTANSLTKCASMIFPSSLGFATLVIEPHNCVCVFSFSFVSFISSVCLMHWEVYMGMLPLLPFLSWDIGWPPFPLFVLLTYSV